MAMHLARAYTHAVGGTALPEGFDRVASTRRVNGPRRLYRMSGTLLAVAALAARTCVGTGSVMGSRPAVVWRAPQWLVRGLKGMVVRSRPLHLLLHMIGNWCVRGVTCGVHWTHLVISMRGRDRMPR